MFAVIRTGGKQYLVAPGDKIKIEKIDKPEGGEVTFNQVLLAVKNKSIKIGAPLVKGAKVKAKVLKQGKAKKVIIFIFSSTYSKSLPMDKPRPKRVVFIFSGFSNRSI